MDKPVTRESSMKLMEMLRTINPKPVPCSQEIRDWWTKEALPVLRDQALSELRRNDCMDPRLVGIMKDGTMGLVDIAKATGGTFGSRASKDATAFVHKIAAMVPGTMASVFCVEAWALHGKGNEELDRNIEKYPNLGDHPDRYEVIMFNMLHYNIDTNTMMQLSTMIEVIKVLGVPRRREMWQHTKLADEEMITDPHDPNSPMKMTGRFIVGSEENPK